PIRDHYLDCYRKTIAKAKRELERVVPELLIEPNGSTEPEQLFKLIRVDVIGMHAGKHVIREVVLGPAPMPDALLGFSWPISLFPTAWHGLELEVAAQHTPEGELLAWTEKWLDPSDRRPEDEHGLQGVIHNMQRPQALKSQQGYCLAIDLGSAPLLAL